LTASFECVQISNKIFNTLECKVRNNATLKR